MNLLELKHAVDSAVAKAEEGGEDPQSIPVTIQIDDMADPHHGYVQTNREVQLHYDGNCNASGCVIQGWRDSREGHKLESVLRDAGYKVVEGADAVRRAIADHADPSLPPACSGYGVFPDGSKCGGCVDCAPDAQRGPADHSEAGKGAG